MALTDTYASVTFSSSKGATNNTTAVEVVPDPGTGARAYVVDKEAISVLNRDTVDAIIILTLTGGTPQIIAYTTLSSGDTWTNPSRIAIGEGETLTVELSGAVTTNQLTWQSTYYQLID